MRASLCATALLLVATALCVSARDATDRTRNASHQSSGYELKARNLRWSTADDVVVDAVFGNDTLCRTNVSFPCQTISTAIVLVEFTAHMNSSTIGVRNGRYPVCDVKVTAARLMLRSSCSSGSAEDCAVTLDCTGCDYCFQLQTEASVIEFANLAMVGSRVFAIPYLSSDLSFTNVTFSNHTGGILEHTISASTFPTLNLTGCRISDNNLTQPVISHQAGRVELESTVFVRNQLHSSMNASTALIACVEGIVEAAFCEFSDNVAINASVLQFWDLARVFVISSMFQRNVGLTTVAVIQSGIATTLEVSFDDCTFSDNAATGPLEHGYGGAIGTLLVDSVWSITSTTFTNNSAAASSGGALFFRAPYATQAVLSISNSKFVLNNAHADGGAICVRSQSDDGNYTLASQSGSKYRTVGRQAGSVDVIIDQCTFSGNAVESGRGGAVAVATTSGSGTRIQHSICSGNRAQLEGGCLMVQGSGLSDFTVENSTFTNNNAFTDGGAVAVRGEFTEPSILTSHFERNGAVSGGGAVLIDAVGAVISNCSFEFNNAAILGGAVKFQASVTTAHSTVRFTEFRNNSAYKGGAVAVQSTFVHLTWIQCIGNTAVINGGCIFIANAALTYGEDCQFAGNIATGSSAGPSGSRSEIVGLRGAGGAIYIYNSFFRLVRANLRNNSAPTDAGGAICATTSGLQMSAVTLQNNSALFGGAVATVLQSDTGLGRCTFLNNSATEGGAIYSAQTSTTSVASCDFRFNTASESGGAVTVTDPFSFGSASFHSCGFSDNLALGVAEGGGALCIRYMTVGVEEGNFTNNSAPNSGGGAIYWTEAEPVYTEPIVWMNNSARYGDDVSSSACSTAVMHPDAYANTSFANGPLFSIQPPISLELLDCLGQRVLLDTQTTQFASVGPLDFVQGITTSDYVDGVLTFNTLYLRTLEETVVLQFETPLNGKGLYTSLQLTVKPCPAGYFLSSDLACTPCAAGSFSQSTPNISQTVCELCSAGSFSGSAGQSTCAVCPVGRFASEVGSASCQSCGSVDGYTLGNGSRLCQSCVNANGLECRNGKAAIARGFWGYPIANETRLGTVRCPAGYCNGGPPVHGECASHRVPESPLCGQCESGYVSYLSSPECVRCDETNVGMVALLLLLMWLFVLLVMLLSSGRSKQTAELKVLLFFTSTARIILGDASRWTQWLRLLENGDVGATGFGLCVFALSPYSLEVLQMVFPSLALAELAVTAGVLWIACHFEWISWEWFNGNRFLRTAMALLTFR